jgi:hypothetical protein
LALSIGTGLFTALFATRLGYLAKLNAYNGGKVFEKWNSSVNDLKSKITDGAFVEAVNAKFQAAKSVNLDAFKGIEKSMRCANSADTTAWKPASAQFVSEAKALADFTPSGTQFNEYLMSGLQNGLIWGVGIAIALYVILKLSVFKEILSSLSEMPPIMKQLWWVKFFTWYGLPLMWQYLTLAAAKYAFNAPSPDANLAGFEEGGKWGGLCFAAFSVTCFLISIFIPRITKAIGSARATHAMFLTIGGIGFFMVMLGNTKETYLIAMSVIGLAWGSIMSLPYTMLASSVKGERMGVYMGIFNGFVCVPQFIGMLTVPLFYKSLLGDDPRNALILAGVCMLLAAVSCFLVEEKKTA